MLWIKNTLCWLSYKLRVITLNVAGANAITLKVTPALICKSYILVASVNEPFPQSFATLVLRLFAIYWNAAFESFKLWTNDSVSFPLSLPPIPICLPFMTPNVFNISWLKFMLLVLQMSQFISTKKSTCHVVLPSLTLNKHEIWNIYQL